MLGCWKLSQQPSTHPPMTLPLSSISFYLLLMPGLACQGCGFCSTAGTAWPPCSASLSPSGRTALPASLHHWSCMSGSARHKLLFSPLCYSFSSPLWGICHWSDTAVTRNKLCILAFLLHSNGLTFSITVRCRCHELDLKKKSAAEGTKITGIEATATN